MNPLIGIKKIASCFLAIVMFASIIPFSSTVYATDPLQVTVSNATGAAGDIVTVSISIPADSSLASAGMLLKYDNTKLTCSSATKGPIAEGMLFSNLTFAVDGNNTTIKAGYAFFDEDADADTCITQAGVLMNVKFTVKSGWFGTTNLSLTFESFKNANAGNISHVILQGGVSVPLPVYTIKFDANGGIGGIIGSMNQGAALVAPEVAREGYTFTGWLPEVPGTVPGEDSTYTAQWSINSYTVRFDANGGIGFANAISQDYGSNVVLPMEGFTRTWFTFLGWNTSPDATTALAYFNIPAVDVTLYAVWERVPVTFSVKDGETTIIDRNGHYIYGLTPGMKTSEFENEFVQVNGDGDIVFTYPSGSFGTGTKVDIVDNVTNEVKETYYIVIFGDVNGDGNIDSIDAGTMVDVENKSITWNPSADAAFIKAGNVNGDVNVDSLDAGIAVDFENEMINIDQITGLQSQR